MSAFWAVPALQDPFEALKFEAPLEELKARLEKGEPVPWQGPSPWDGSGKTFVLYNCNYIYTVIYLISTRKYTIRIVDYSQL